MSYDLIDPPITPYSSRKELDEWREYLLTLPASTQVDAALEQVREYIEWNQADAKSRWAARQAKRAARS